MSNTTVVINVAGGVVQEVLTNSDNVKVLLADFDDNDSIELSEKYVDVLYDESFKPAKIKSLID